MWRQKLSSMPLNYRDNCPWYSFRSKLGGPKSLCGRCEVEKKNLFPLAEIDSRFLGRLVCNLVIIPTDLMLAHKWNETKWWNSLENVRIISKNYREIFYILSVRGSQPRMKEINMNEKWNDSGQVNTQRVGYPNLLLWKWVRTNSRPTLLLAFPQRLQDQAEIK